MFIYDEFDALTIISYVGIKLKGLAEAADNYHVLLTENRKLYNEVQDLKGTYCSMLRLNVSPFLAC